MHTRPAIVVAGGSSGVGEALVSLLGDQEHVYNLDTRNPAPSATCDYRKVDLTRYTEVDAFAEELRANAVVLSGVAVVAGRGYGTPFCEMSTEDFALQVQENLHIVFNVFRALRGRLAKPASLVATSSIFSTGGQGSIGYAAAKAGIVGLVKALAFELGSQGVRVNCVVPGAVDTPMLRSTTTHVQRTMLNKFAPLGTARATEVAEAIRFLLGEQSSKITGHAMVVDGGISVGYHPML